MRSRFRERGDAVDERPANALDSESRRDRLQPYLLDRLTDDAPNEKSESRDRRAATVEELRGRLLRDLHWLLNTRLCDEADSGYQNRELLKKSVLRYGIPDMSGRTVMRLSSPAVARRLETAIREAIQTYEPRIVAKTLRVRLIQVRGEGSASADKSTGAVETAPGQIVLEISGEMFCQPANQPLLVRTCVDLESGTCDVEAA